MAVPVLRDVTIQPPRSNSAGSQGRVQELQVVCYTGRGGPGTGVPGATNCNVVAEYGPTTSYGTTTTVTPLSGRHEFPIGDLTPGTEYHVRIKATDPTDAANPAYSQDYTIVQTPGDLPTGPTVTTGAVTGITTAGATIPWTTTPACPSGQVNYSTSPTLEPLSVKSETGGTVTSHSTALTGLTAVTRYYYRIFQVAPNGASTLSGLRSFVTI